MVRRDGRARLGRHSVDWERMTRWNLWSLSLSAPPPLSLSLSLPPSFLVHTYMYQLLWGSEAQLSRNPRLASGACLLSFLRPGYTHPVGSTVCHWVSLRLHNLHGLLHCIPPPTRRCGQWLQAWPTEYKVNEGKGERERKRERERERERFQMYDLNCRPEQLTNEVWDYIFFGTELPATDIPADSLRYDNVLVV